MKKIILLNKKEGETPLEALEVFRKKSNVYENIKMTYAGRLDPMASGLLLVLAAEEVKNKEKYLKLNKEYEFEILFGFATDTYDVLGKVINSSKGEHLNTKELEKLVNTKIKKFVGKFFQDYPSFSSKTVAGKPLFEYAREGKEVKTQKREIEVKELRFIKIRKTSSKKILKDIEKRVKKVKGDFRQKEILKIWRKKLAQRKPGQFVIGKFTIKCGSGTYVRGIANSLGEEIHIPALAYSIKRTRIGKWSKPS